MDFITIFAIVFTYLLLSIFFMSLWKTAIDSEGLEFCNPCWLYKKKELSVFSCVFVAVFANITVLPYALGYWFYKACTIRRK